MRVDTKSLTFPHHLVASASICTDTVDERYRV
jgi:hypothetical protein